MASFFRSLLATLVGLILFTVIGILILVGIISAASADKEFEVKDNSILHIKLDRPIVERSSDDPFEDLAFLGGTGKPIGLLELLSAIRKASADDRIKGIYLESSNAMSGFSTLKEIRDAIHQFQDSGKFVLAYSELLTEGDYYLSSVANELYLNPQGGMELNGLRSEVTFFKGTFEKLEIEPVIFRVGEFKSAIEPLVREKMSDENREQISALLFSLNKQMLEEVSAGRKMEFERVKEISDKMLVRSNQDAIDLGIADSLFYFDQVQKRLAHLVEIDDVEKLKLIRPGQYRSNPEYSKGTFSKNRIAVLVADGTIVSGQGDSRTVGSDRFTKEIRKVANDDKVKAIVLRVNSPGGSLLASDVIWRELMEAREKKPIIASMSDVAASGGYYLSMACDTIVAQPNAITGSIGIFGTLFNLEKFLKNKLGITTDVVKTGEFSDIFTVTRSLSDVEKAIIQKSVEEGYETFTTKAAANRNMELEDLIAVASGRAWSGSDAMERGLVDVMGGVYKAIEIAAMKADIEDDYMIKVYPERKPFFEEFFSKFGEEIQARYIRYKAGDLYPYLQHLQEIKHYEGIQARLPYELQIQ